METADTWRADMAASTLKIIADGFYIVDGEKIDLRDIRDGRPRDWGVWGNPAVCWSPRDCESLHESPPRCVDEEDPFRPFQKGEDRGGLGRVWITSKRAADVALSSPADLLTIVSPASPRQVDNGFLQGKAGETELDLCRRSTLHAYLASEAADYMYKKNQEADSPLETRYTLYLPIISIFRDAEGMLLPDPVQVQVLSVAVPDLGKAARAGISAQKRGRAVMTRIRNTVNIAGQCMGRVLVLDGWAGPSGENEPERMAQYFKQVLVDENFASMFDHVIFALPDDAQREAFEQVFGEAADTDEEAGYGEAVDDADVPGFTAATLEFPQCNYTEEINEDNLGYRCGLMSDGTPFVTEWYISRRNGDGEPTRVDMSFMIPTDMELDDIPDEPDTEDPLADPDSNIVGYHGFSPARDQGILHIGMLDGGQDPSLERTMAAAQCLIDAGMLTYTTSMMNGALFYCYDEATQQVVMRFNVTVWEDDLIVAKTPLRFYPFAAPDPTPHLVLLPSRKHAEQSGEED